MNDTTRTSGVPSVGFVPLSVPEIHGNEWEYVKECLDTSWVSSAGSYVDRFEKSLAAETETAYAVATVNGTSALHVALLVAGVRADDEVLVSSLSFIAPANAIRYAGAWPVFIDAEPAFWQMDPQKLTDFLVRDCDWRDGALINRSTRRKVTAIVPVHILGHPADMEPIIAVSRKYGLKIIADATESLGSKYHGEASARYGDISCISFNGNKIITTGGGGMIVTDSEEWARRAKYLTTQAKDDEVEYIHGDVGYNYRLTNIQAAMGCAQMELLHEFVETKRRIAATYTKELSGVTGITTMPEPAYGFSTFWMYTILVDEASFGMSSRGLLAALARHQIQTRPLWQPLHRSPAHAGAFRTECPVSEKLNRMALSLPCSAGLTGEQQAHVVEQILHVATGQTAQEIRA